MRKSLFSVMFSSALVIALLCTVCGAGRISAANNEQPQQQPESFEIQSTPDEGAAQYIITKQIYSEKNITINYPKIAGLSSQKLQESINKLIKNDALNCLVNNPEGADSLNDYSLKIDYLIKWQGANLLSIEYMGYGYAPGYAGNRKLYTTNINMTGGEKLRLKDMVVIDNNFVKKLKNGKFIAVDPAAKEIMATDEFTDANLINKLNGADATSEGSTFSYFTKDALGISLEVPHVIGDQIIFEVQYQDIIDNIKTNNTAWLY
ncbi:MAG: DUF4163 domain-containing protein [Bacillota bacterium]